jgi:hypothetical protein
MPRIGKTTSTSNSSEIISSAESYSDSESSNSSDYGYGSGDEGKTNTNNPINEATSVRPVLPCSTKLSVGLYCSLVALTGAISLIYCGIQLNNNSDNNSRVGYSIAFTTGTVATAVGSLCTIWACARPSNSIPQVTNA